jgi:hypothetical protein
MSVTQILAGSGAQSGRLYDLWAANGKPERIGYAATNGSVDAGKRWAASAGVACAGGVLALREDAGKLYGQWCGVEGVALVIPGTPDVWVPGTADVWVPGWDAQVYTTHSNPAVSLPSPFSSPSNLTIWGNIGVAQRMSYPPGFAWAYRANGTWPYWEGNGAVPAYYRPAVGGMGGQHVGSADFVYTLPAQAGYTIPGTPGHTVAGTPDQVVPILSAGDQVAAISLGSLGVPWVTASVWSHAGEWVRIKSWSDANKMIRHEAGPGTTRAVAVIKSSGEPVARVVRAAEFGVAEFNSLEWVKKYADNGFEVDLTPARIAVDAPNWVLWKLDAVVAASGAGAASPPAGGATAATPATAATSATGIVTTPQGFVYRRGGQDILVPAKDISGAEWQP